MVFYMTIINSFLQKKKLCEFSHGFYMVIAAYVLSFLLLVIGSDTLYNIRSKAGRVNAQSDEENRVFEIPDDNEGQAAVHGSADYMSSRSRVESRIDKRSKYQLINQQSQPVAASDDTNWLLGFAMNDEEYSRFMYLMGKNEVFAETDDKSISSFSSVSAWFVAIRSSCKSVIVCHKVCSTEGIGLCKKTISNEFRSTFILCRLDTVSSILF